MTLNTTDPIAMAVPFVGLLGIVAWDASRTGGPR